jgi:hypothetical protein
MKARGRTLVTTHQIRNVLRVYGNQLKRRNNLVQESLEPGRKHADRVEISSEARRRQAMNRMSEQVMSRIPQQTPAGKFAVAGGETLKGGRGGPEQA